MSDRITAKELGSVAATVTRQLVELGLAHSDESLVIEAGSATYGRAWKVFVTGGQYGTAWHTPAFGSLNSVSARELRGKLLAVSNTLYVVATVGHGMKG